MPTPAFMSSSSNGWEPPSSRGVPVVGPCPSSVSSAGALSSSVPERSANLFEEGDAANGAIVARAMGVVRRPTTMGSNSESAGELIVGGDAASGEVSPP